MRMKKKVFKRNLQFIVFFSSKNSLFFPSSCFSFINRKEENQRILIKISFQYNFINKFKEPNEKDYFKINFVLSHNPFFFQIHQCYLLTFSVFNFFFSFFFKNICYIINDHCIFNFIYSIIIIIF